MYKKRLFAKGFCSYWTLVCVKKSNVLDLLFTQVVLKNVLPKHLVFKKPKMYYSLVEKHDATQWCA